MSTILFSCPQILKIYLYVVNPKIIDDRRVIRVGRHNSITKYNGQIADFPTLLKEEIGVQRGNVVVTGKCPRTSTGLAKSNCKKVCANRRIRLAVRRTIQELSPRDVRLEELDYYPYDTMKRNLSA